MRSDFEVVALCNRTRAKAEALAERVAQETGKRPAVYADYSAMLGREKLDAVTLALPTVINPHVTQAALAAGCHVLVEKPIAASVEDGERMLGWPKQYGRVLMVAENCRYLDSYQHTAHLVAEGAIGRVITAQWLLCPYTAPDNQYALTSWRQEPAHPGGFLSDGGVHHMATLRTVLGEVGSVQASVASYRPDLKPADTLVAVMNWASGGAGQLPGELCRPGTVFTVAGDRHARHGPGNERMGRVAPRWRRGAALGRAESLRGDARNVHGLRAVRPQWTAAALTPERGPGRPAPDCRHAAIERIGQGGNLAS